MKIKKTLRLKRPLPIDDERALLRQARDGDAEASGALVRAHYQEIYRTSCQLLGNPEDAQDLTQDCFVKALGGLGRFRGDASFRNWLRRILVHLARDRFRRRGRRPEESEISPDFSSVRQPNPQVAAGRSEVRRLVDESIRALPPNLRVPLVLRAVEGWSYEEIAHATGVTSATARTQVMKARRRLHKKVGDLLEEDPR